MNQSKIILFLTLLFLCVQFIKSSEQCPNRAKYFLGGLLYNAAIDELSAITMKPDLEKCVDSAVNTIYDFKVRFDKLKNENEASGFFSKCANGACQLAKFSTKLAISVLLETYGLQDSLETAFNLVDNTAEAISKFWNEKAAPFFDLIFVFFKSLDISQILNSLTTCFGKTKVYLFMAKIGLRTLDYFTDSAIVKIGLGTLNIADKSLTKYETLKNHKIVGPIIDLLPMALPGGGITTAIKIFKGNKDLQLLAIKGLVNIFRNSLKNWGPLLLGGSKLLLNLFNPELGYYIVNVVRDLRTLSKEDDECKRAAYWGKVVYKIVRILKSLFVGSLDKIVETDTITQEEVERINEISFDSMNLFE